MWLLTCGVLLLPAAFNACVNEDKLIADPLSKAFLYNAASSVRVNASGSGCCFTLG